MFAASSNGRKLVITAELAAFVAMAGVGRPLRVGLQAALACAAGRATWVLFHSLKRMQFDEQLQSVWDW